MSANTPASTTPEVSASTTPQVDASPTTASFAELQQQAKRESAIRQSIANTAQCLETNQHYSDLGCFYAATTPVANSFGAELGVATRDPKTGEVQRTGIGLYIRSDHAVSVKFTCPDI